MKVHHDQETSKSGVIDKSTLIPIGLVGVFILGTVGVVNWLNDRFNMIDRRLERMEDRMVDSFTRSEMNAWTLTLSRDNPNLKVPDIHK